MTRWARLTWQAADPGALAASLVRTLGVHARPGGLVPGALSIDLGSGWLEIRPWVRESATDEPLPGGRLMLEPVSGGEPSPEDADPGADRPVRLGGTGWATVELDRAEDELSMWLGDGGADDGARPHDGEDPHLGARARIRSPGGLPGDAFVLLEPSTEGRLAASLVRDGEGPCALYLRPAGGVTPWAAAARTRGEVLAAPQLGPLGEQVLVGGGPAAGPHLLLVDPPRGSNRKAAPRTIAG